MSDKIKARIRTWWPLAMGHLAAWLLVHAAPVVEWAARYDIRVSQAEVAIGIGFVLAGVIWEAARWLESRPGSGWWARASRTTGRWLISLGLHTGRPTYEDPPVNRSAG